MSTLVGRRLKDTPLSEFAISGDEIQPGDYWKCLTTDGSRALNVKDHLEDRQYWGNDPRHDQNLTGGVWHVVTPLGQHAILSIHTVREEDDGTISIRPGDGSSNSVLVGDPNRGQWHGYIEHGVWSEC